MSKLTDWIIKKLGGITKDEQEKTRISYEEWAVKHLRGKNGEYIINENWLSLDNDNVMFLRSNIKGQHLNAKVIKAAPWCKNISIDSVVSKSPPLVG